MSSFYTKNRLKTLKMKNLSLKYEKNKIEFPKQLSDHFEFLQKKAEVNKTFLVSEFNSSNLKRVAELRVLTPNV